MLAHDCQAAFSSINQSNKQTINQSDNQSIYTMEKTTQLLAPPSTPMTWKGSFSVWLLRVMGRTATSVSGASSSAHTCTPNPTPQTKPVTGSSCT
jgi:hypothetical protein